MKRGHSTEWLELQVNSQVEMLRGTAGIAIIQPRSGYTLSVNGRLSFPSASLIKLPILSEYARQVDQGRLDPERVVDIQPEDVVGGTGVIKDLAPGARLRLADLVTLMIVLSDNVATNLLIKVLGLESINRLITSLGLSQTRLQRQMMDFASRRKGIDNVTSPADMAAWFVNLLDRPAGLAGADSATMPSPFSGGEKQMMLAILERQQERHKLPARLPDEVRLAYKTGDLPGVEHDAGIMWLAGQPVIVVAMSCDLTRNLDGVKFCQEIGRAVHATFG